LPVGSSTRMTSGLFASARANATRCCCPPDSCPGAAPCLSGMPSSVRSSFADRRASLRRRPTSSSGSSTLSITDNVGNRLKNRNTKSRSGVRRRLAFVRRLRDRPAAGQPRASAFRPGTASGEPQTSCARSPA
jgi:hypothetical protein